MKEELKQLKEIASNLRVLYVEDNPHTREATVGLFQNFFETLFIASDGEEALEMFQTKKVDLIFTDICIPCLNGIELIKRIREEDGAIPIVVLSAYNDSKYLVEAISLNVDGYIIKPINLTKFLAILKKTVLKYRLAKQEQETSLLYKRLGESTKFASAIQHSLIPPQKSFASFFKEFFTIWQPRDIVGGDFYFFTKIDSTRALLMVIDCTGHGVHGAFLTMLCEVIYRQIVGKISSRNFDELEPSDILNEFNRALIEVFYARSSNAIEGKGFDAQVLLISKKEETIKFCGAKNPLFYIKNNTLHKIEGDPCSVGYNVDKNFKFSSKSIKMTKNIQIYLATDGFWDQLGGAKKLPFGKKRFLGMIEEHHQMPMDAQRQIYLDTLKHYQEKSGFTRVDDVTFIGITL